MALAMHLLLFLWTIFLNTAFAQLYMHPNSQNDRDITQPGPCPGILPASPDFEFPHLIIPISASNPTTAYPNTLTPSITAGDFSAVFNFDLPKSRSGQMCTMKFFFPNSSQLSTSSFELDGDGAGTYSFSLSILGAGAVEDGVVTCPWHAWRFKVSDGTWCDNPRIKIDSFEVGVVGEEIQVRGEGRGARGEGTKNE